MSDKEILERAVDLYGIDNQVEKLIEECAELIQACLKYKNRKNAAGFSEDSGTFQNLCEEIADVSILVDQFKSVWPHTIDGYLETKMKRLDKRISFDSVKMKRWAERNERFNRMR